MENLYWRCPECSGLLRTATLFAEQFAAMFEHTAQTTLKILRMHQRNWYLSRGGRFFKKSKIIKILEFVLNFPNLNVSNDRKQLFRIQTLDKFDKQSQTSNKLGRVKKVESLRRSNSNGLQ